MKLSNERSESFKKYTTEKGSLFMDHAEYKKYLRLPYLLQTLPKDDELLEGLLSDEFSIKLLTETMEEIDHIIFYTTKVTINRSFLTKSFEYNLRTNPSFSKPSIEQLYQRIQKNTENHSHEISELEHEIDELDQLSGQLQGRYNALKTEFINKAIEEEDKHLHIDKHVYKGVTVTQLSMGQKYVNWMYKDFFHQLVDLRKGLTTAKRDTREKDVAYKMREIEFEKLKQEIRRPSGMERHDVQSPQVPPQEHSNPDSPSPAAGVSSQNQPVALPQPKVLGK